MCGICTLPLDEAQNGLPHLADRTPARSGNGPMSLKSIRLNPPRINFKNVELSTTSSSSRTISIDG